ncbi:SDR family NAD(P)-dependent oxidoreductase [Aquipuribacter sp. SD81]|uniref:SDR family NAD(P)-dependent oxidoreductase n=1 Tax=Aquipuribacter sp. SD81 TaxID=3127703 RepID=UPI0030198CE4
MSPTPPPPPSTSTAPAAAGRAPAGAPRGTAVVTGASSGIGEASARALAAAGFHVVVAARRVERLEALAAELGGRAVRLDVTDDASVAALAEAVADLPSVDCVVHSAGGALGLEPVLDSDLDRWQRMFDSNVLGVARVTQALAPRLRASGRGHVVVIGSIAGSEVYPGGAGYAAAKHAVRAVTETLRWELHTEGIRVSEVAPGMVHTPEFSLVRFDGDAERAAKVYEGARPVHAEDVAEVVAFVATRPPHVDIDRVVVKPVGQANGHVVHRPDA